MRTGEICQDLAEVLAFRASLVLSNYALLLLVVTIETEPIDESQARPFSYQRMRRCISGGHVSEIMDEI